MTIAPSAMGSTKGETKIFSPTRTIGRLAFWDCGADFGSLVCDAKMALWKMNHAPKIRTDRMRPLPVNQMNSLGARRFEGLSAKRNNSRPRLLQASIVREMQ